MATVRFEPAEFETAVAPGTRLVDVTDEHPESEVPYSCRSASCGTCRVEVLEGGDALAPMEEDEIEVVEIFGDEPGKVRLCCQLVLAKETEKVVLKVCDP